MTREELIESLTLLKEQARNSGANTFVWDINIDSFNFVIDSAIKELEQEPKIGNKVSGDLLGGLYCSNCMTYVNEYFNYCPHCGAKMVEPQESEDKE